MTIVFTTMILTIERIRKLCNDHNIFSRRCKELHIEKIEKLLGQLIDDNETIDGRFINKTLVEWKEVISERKKWKEYLKEHLIALCVLVILFLGGTTDETDYSYENVMQVLLSRKFRAKRNQSTFLYVAQIVQDGVILHKSSGKSKPYEELQKLYEDITGVTPKKRKNSSSPPVAAADVEGSLNNLSTTVSTTVKPRKRSRRADDSVSTSSGGVSPSEKGNFELDFPIDAASLSGLSNFEELDW